MAERVSETGQKAIIAWNGTYEILMLSTDVNSSKESEVVEIMPLPSNPTISKGELQSFFKVRDLVNTYLAVISPRYYAYYPSFRQGIDNQTAPKIIITFQETIGVHYLTVINVEETNELIQWLENFLETKGYSKELPSNIENLLSYYMQIGMSFFVIDMIKTNETIKTIDPLIYKFKSSNLYYPLRISTLFSGKTDISLFTITNSELNEDSITSIGFVKKALFQIKQETLSKISGNITQLFFSNPYLCYFQCSSSLESFSGDILANSQSSLALFTLSAILSIGLGLILLILLFPRSKIGPLSKGIQAPTTRRLEIALLLAGLIGIFLTLAGCFFPLGLIGYGENGEVLINLSGSYGVPLLTVEIGFLFGLLLLIVIPLYVYSILIHRGSRDAPWILTAGGVCMMLQVIISNVYYLYTIGIGLLIIVIGCSFTLLAGLLSFWYVKLVPTDILLANKKIALRTRIFKNCLVAIVTLIGVSLYIFWLWHFSFPWYMYI